MIQRHITRNLLAALSDTPVTLLVGARQTGKSTLCRAIAEGDRPARYHTFDEASTLAAAHADPAGFLASLEGPVVLDEIQRVPELLRGIKVDVDRHRKPGRYLLTGSVNVLMLPRVSDSLAGRMEVMTLWPLSQGEIDGRTEHFVELAFARATHPPRVHPVDRHHLFERALKGGFPEVLQRDSPERRNAWFGSYLTTILQRDVRDLANIDSLTALPRLLALIAARAPSPVNVAELARVAGIPQTTLKRYLTLLETTFLIRLIPAWAKNLSKRIVRTPRLVLTDTGLLSHLTGWTPDRLRQDPTAAGPLLEGFALMELVKQSSWSRIRPDVFHFRTHAGHEVDIVLEAGDGRLVGVEVKASATVGEGDFKGLEALREAGGKRFHRGIVLYTGRESLPFGPDLWALPFSALWIEGA